MLRYISRRLLILIPTLWAISIVTFIVIQLPPGDYLTTVRARLQEQGDGSLGAQELARLTERYGLDEPVLVQYWKWFTNIILRGDFGDSFDFGRPVSDLLAERLPLTIMLSVLTLLFIWAVSFPIGVYSAVRQYSIGDYSFTFLGYLGLAIPNFLIALVLMWISLRYFGMSVGGLFSPEYRDAPWSLAKFGDLMSHLWIPVVIWGTAGTAANIRVLRANLLDELRKPYVVAARARGMPKRWMTIKYPVRVAMNPFFSTIGWILPGLIAADAITSQVLNLNTTGPLLLRSLLAQDMYLAGSILLISAVLVVIGTLISDIALAWLDPRVRLRY
ncbi:ABC transporter permease [Phytoactinopolyspora mesophila]|uniref:ABC transporter permease subunit n=1 Tax=Phytoactinopolyspora mesophila TaxID=2650750 RepID=A0A7K3LYF2_9ACTN|nr:ABC transporter permease [Phytoactinopolyspora mesophila]NDL56055.1 ABC transporter permease subunit [Phytoactinopolyspora mesophila]